MKRTLGWGTSIYLATAASVVQLLAADPGEVTTDTINVRGQPTVQSEVITKLKKGESVTILEEVAASKQKGDEPKQWYRIAMPPNTPVWVSAQYVDATNKTVLARRLNVRSGPGENYSVVGRFDKGETIQEIRKVNDWMEIQAPANAYAFVATDLITKGGKPNAETTPTAAKVTAPPVVVAPTAVVEKPVETKQPEAPPVTEAPPAVQKETVKAENIKETPPVVAQVETKKEPAQAEVPPVVAQQPAPVVAVAPAIVEPANATQVKRIVKREGFVRRSTSIQSPTTYRLESEQTGKTINYLHAPEGEKLMQDLLKEYVGYKVQVTGEEVIDQRWPNIPMIEIQLMDLFPL